MLFSVGLRRIFTVENNNIYLESFRMLRISQDTNFSMHVDKIMAPQQRVSKLDI